VYKGRRPGGAITAIKLLPTPIHKESAEDKNFISFQNEVEKLKKVNEHPNPNVVTILNSGITDSGNLPFIEMEYIEGDDLAELLHAPHDPVFAIKETLKVGEQLAHALSHCHNVGVRHGDIKSNNVKFSVHSGNYILLDFGLSVMSDEQRRTSLRHAGAIEFMAPEQNTGQMLFETDIYSFGVIMYELLAGSVPFPLKDNGETARNAVMVAHMEMPPPDLLALRKNSMPSSWSEEKKRRELEVPQWFVSMIYKCLEKDPVNRFANGMEVYEFIQHNRIMSPENAEWNSEQLARLREENDRLIREKEQLHKLLLRYEINGEKKLISGNGNTHIANKQGALFSKQNIGTTIAVVIALAVLAYSLFGDNKQKPMRSSDTKLQNDSLTVPAKTEDPGVIVQLRNADEYLRKDSIGKALVIYKSLAGREIAEAMYKYGDLSLKHYGFSNCREAFNFLIEASHKNYPAAKRTLGYLYSYADDADALKSQGYYRCEFRRNIKKGAALLMEAIILGDSTAVRLLQKLNERQNNKMLAEN
ncbi:MAG: protein kinase, partial [Chitinophagaceae bacterium]